MNAPIQVGVTGGIGSGKTLVCRLFSKLGSPIYNADERAKFLMANNPNLIRSIKEGFGATSYLEDGSLNRAFLAEEVFKDQQKVARLNSLVHPLVREDYKQWVKKYSNRNYVIREAALMIESGTYKDLDFLINVFCEEKIRIKRVKIRDPQRSEEQIKSIIENQVSEKERQEKSDFIINNSGDELVIPQVLELHKKFTLIKTKS